MSLPVVDAELVRRLGQVEAACIERRMRSTCLDGADPLGVVIEQHGPASVFAAVKAPEMGFFNQVIGLVPEQAEELDELLAIYRRHDIRPRVTCLPGSLDGPLAAALLQAGLRPTDWWSILYREATPVEVSLPRGVEIQRPGAAEAASFGRVFSEGFDVGATAEERAAAERVIGRWVTDVPDFECYLAYCDGQPAAIAVLYREDELGYLAAAATVPEFRGRGCQAALIAQRIRDAAEQGCTVAVVHTGFATASQRNQERADFRLAATCQTWRQPKPDEPAAGEVS